MEDVVKDAISLGAKEICFTDHTDYGVKTDWDSGEEVIYKAGMARLNVDYPRYVKEVTHLQEKYDGQIVLKMGMEFGVQMHTIDKYEKLFAKYPFDFIILSNSYCLDNNICFFKLLSLISLNTKYSICQHSLQIFGLSFKFYIKFFT